MSDSDRISALPTDDSDNGAGLQAPRSDPLKQTTTRVDSFKHLLGGPPVESGGSRLMSTIVFDNHRTSPKNNHTPSPKTTLRGTVWGGGAKANDETFDQTRPNSTPGDQKTRYAGTILEHPLNRLTGQCTVLSHEGSFIKTQSLGVSPAASFLESPPPSHWRRNSIRLNGEEQDPEQEQQEEHGSPEQHPEIYDPTKGMGYRQERRKSRMQRATSFHKVTSIRKAMSLRQTPLVPETPPLRVPRKDSCTSDSSGLSGFSHDTGFIEDEDSEDYVDQKLYLRLYLSVGFLLLLTLSDCVSCFVLQMLWAPGDFLCDRRLHSDTAKVTVDWHYVNLAVMAGLLALHCLYVVQQLVRADGDGRRVGLRYFASRDLFNTWRLAVNVLHVVTLGATCGLLCWHAKLCAKRGCEDGLYLVVRRFHLVLHVVRGVLSVHFSLRLVGDIRRRLQRAVSNTKRRFLDRDTNFDLDLTYVADRLLSLSLPCIENAPYRNDMRDVARFFATRHYGSFIILNLCEPHEEGGNGNYHPDLLYGQVQKLPMRDHNPPTLQGLVGLCEAASEFLNRKSDNVLAIHCQGGKGRTGLFNCAMMLWTGFLETASEAQDYFSRRRTQPGSSRHQQQRISSPSQIRYLGYIEKIVWSPIDPAGFHPVLLHRIRLHHPPGTDGTESLMLSVVIERHSVVLYDHCKAHGPVLTANAAHNHNVLDIDVGTVLIDGDISVRVFVLKTGAEQLQLRKGASGKVIQAGRGIKYGSVKGKVLCFVSFHTAFLDENSTLFKRQFVDGCHKPKHLQDHAFPPDFALELDITRRPTRWPSGHLDPGISALTAASDAVASPVIDVMSRIESAGDGAGSSDPDASITSLASNESEPWAMSRPLGRSYSDRSDHARPVRMSGPPIISRSTSLTSEPVPEGSAMVLGEFSPAPSWSGQSLGEQERREREREHERRDTMVQAELLAAERTIQLHERLYSVLQDACCGIDKYRSGECVRDTHSHNSASSDDLLVVVLHGCIELEIGGMVQGALGLVEDPLLLRFGRGQLLGTLGLRSLGLDRVGTVMRWRVKSDKAMVARLPLQQIGLDQQLNSEQPAGRLPSTAVRYSEADLCVLYEVVCRQVCSFSYCLARLEQLVSIASNAKVDPGAIKTNHLQLHKQVIQYHGLPLNTKVLKSVAGSVMDSKKVPGRLILFSDYLIFCPNGGTRSKDLVIHMHRVQFARASRDSLFLALRPPDIPADAAAKRSPSGFPRSASPSRVASLVAPRSSSPGRRAPSQSQLLISAPRSSNSFKNIAPLHLTPLPGSALGQPTAAPARSHSTSASTSTHDGPNRPAPNPIRPTGSARSVMSNISHVSASSDEGDLSSNTDDGEASREGGRNSRNIREMLSFRRIGSDRKSVV